MEYLKNPGKISGKFPEGSKTMENQGKKINKRGDYVLE